MKVSIVTPVYNDPRVGEALSSVEEQQGISELEKVVIDGGSDDPTKDVLNEWESRVDVLISEPDEGIYDAMNKGITVSTGDVVGILNADDRYADSDVLRDVVDIFEETSVDACYGDLVYVDDKDEVRRYWRSGSYRRHRFWFGWMPPHPTFFVRKKVYEERGTFDLDYPIAADYELMLRLLVVEQVDVRYLDRVMVRMAMGGESNASLGNIVQANREVRRAWKKHGLKGGGLAPFLKPARKVFQFLRSPPR